MIGAGGIGGTHLNAWSQVPGAQIVAVVDVDSARAEQAAGKVGGAAFTDHRAMLDAITPDAVDICTPPVHHPEAAVDALDSGAHVICEKPLAESPVSAHRIVEAAESSGKLLMAAFCHRFHPPVAHLKRLVGDGRLGEVRMFRNRFAGPFAGIEGVWFSNPDVSGGGCLMDTSVHSVDLFRFLVGEVVQVQAAAVTVSDKLKPGVEDTAAMVLRSDTQGVGVIEASWALAAGANVVEVYGTKGTAFIHYWDGGVSRYLAEGMSEPEPLPEDGDRFQGELGHFAAAIRGECALSVTGFDGLRAVEVIYDAYRSAGLR